MIKFTAFRNLNLSGTTPQKGQTQSNNLSAKVCLTILWGWNLQICMFIYNIVKSVQIRSFFWFVFSCIWTEYRKIRTRKKFVLGDLSISAKSFVEKCKPELSFLIFIHHDFLFSNIVLKIFENRLLMVFNRGRGPFI